MLSSKFTSTGKMFEAQKETTPSGTFGTEISNLSSQNVSALNTLSNIVSSAPPAVMSGGQVAPMAQNIFRPFPQGSIPIFPQSLLQTPIPLSSGLGQTAFQNIPPQFVSNRPIGLHMLAQAPMMAGRPPIMPLQNPFQGSEFMRQAGQLPNPNGVVATVENPPMNVAALKAATLASELKKEVIPSSNSTGAAKKKRPIAQDTNGKKKARRNGRKCNVPGCTKLARSTTYQCAAHGGGKRCQYKSEDGQPCKKSARSTTRYCIAHGGGKRCQHSSCDKSAQGATRFCIAHGGGRRCTFKGCNKSARGKKGFCKAHGGGKRCLHGDCDKLVTSKVEYCRKHRPQRICMDKSCNISLSVDRTSDFCARHDQQPDVKLTGSEGKFEAPEIVPLATVETYLPADGHLGIADKQQKAK